MLLDQIQIFGFKRLAAARVYVGRRAVALVGPNEAGKTSLLGALKLFDNEHPVPEASYSRTLRNTPRAPASDVVKLSFVLTGEQQAVVASMPLETKPRHYIRHKQTDGAIKYSLSPAPTLSPLLGDVLLKAWPKFRSLLLRKGGSIGEAAAELELSVGEELELVRAHLAGAVPVADEIWDRLNERREKVEANSKSETAVLEAFDRYYEWGKSSIDLVEKVHSLLRIAPPATVLFSVEDRDLLEQYSIDDPASDAAPALTNLLSVAGVTLEQIRASRNDAAYLKEILEKGSRRLESFFQSRWSQEPVAVGLDIDGSTLQIFVRDAREESVGWLGISERSDGLRTFVALAAFLAKASVENPPILLIDEAEQHLHLNAQADLVQMLSSLPQIQQVIYTTHSPGCLPADIGSGVRFVEPSVDGTSKIRHDFWSIETHSHVGFNPLLMAMGAGAAAFSGLRFALFVEGASDMLLLPTMIRLATDDTDLPYQVAPGISVASQSDLRRMDFTAGRVLFLVDGDVQGREWRADLIRAEVPPERIRALPNGMAIEDLLDRDYYLGVVADFIDISADSFVSLPRDTPLKSALENWARNEQIPLPSAVAIAEQMLGGHETGRKPIVLNPNKRKHLRDLNQWAKRALEIY